MQNGSEQNWVSVTMHKAEAAESDKRATHHIESDGESYTYMKRERIRQSYLDSPVMLRLNDNCRVEELNDSWRNACFHFSCSQKEATMVNKHAHSLLDESLQSSL